MEISLYLVLNTGFLLLCKNYVTFGYPQFQEIIPNGEGLPHPCKPNYLWQGVGHLGDRGGGALNAFGKDFLKLGKKWNKSLCQLDSDNDGKSNGEELGDPDCVWKPGTIPTRQDKITHPGVCDPFTSEKCKQPNAWVDCDLDELKCDAIYTEGVKNITLRMPKTEVPDTETNYMCTVFNLPSDGDYHIIANKPYIDNEYVMHHMLLFGCPDSDKVREMKLNQPQKCNMGEIGCRDIIGMWTVGGSGECYPKEFGYRTGINGYKRVVLQAHWNNPELKDNYYDSSGLVLYYTNKLRPNDAGMLMVGSFHFELPPGKPEVEVIGECSSDCSRQRINQTINVSGAVNHMHYLGKKEKIEIIRDGIKVQDITNEDQYSYDRPIFNTFKTPIQIRPGDELRTTCVFKTSSKANYTYSGPGTNDEMCLGFLSFYPAQHMKVKFCGSWKSLPACELSSPIVRNCHVSNFANVSHPEFEDMQKAVLDHCSLNNTCLDECKDHLKIIRHHPCMKGDTGEFVRHKLQQITDKRIKDFYLGIDSCPEETELNLFSGNNRANYISNLYITVIMSLFVCLFWGL